jgi:hypothetical protein
MFGWQRLCVSLSLSPPHPCSQFSLKQFEIDLRGFEDGLREVQKGSLSLWSLLSDSSSPELLESDKIVEAALKNPLQRNFGESHPALSAALSPLSLSPTRVLLVRC